MNFFKEIFDILWYLAYIGFLGIGVILYVSSKFAKFLPTLGVYKVPGEFVGIIMMILGAWLGGGVYNEQKWNEKLKEDKNRATRIEGKATQINNGVSIEYRDRAKTVVDVREKIKTEIKVVEEYIDRDCKVNDDAIRIHNQAAQGKIVEKKE